MANDVQDGVQTRYELLVDGVPAFEPGTIDSVDSEVKLDNRMRTPLGQAEEEINQVVRGHTGTINGTPKGPGPRNTLAAIVANIQAHAPSSVSLAVDPRRARCWCFWRSRSGISAGPFCSAAWRADSNVRSVSGCAPPSARCSVANTSSAVRSEPIAHRNARRAPS